MGIGFEEVRKGPEGKPIEVIVKVGKQENIRVRSGDHFGDCGDLRVVPFSDVTQQETWTIATKRRGESGDTKGFGGQGVGRQTD